MILGAGNYPKVANRGLFFFEFITSGEAKHWAQQSPVFRVEKEHLYGALGVSTYSYFQIYTESRKKKCHVGHVCEGTPKLLGRCAVCLCKFHVAALLHSSSSLWCPAAMFLRISLSKIGFHIFDMWKVSKWKRLKGYWTSKMLSRHVSDNSHQEVREILI